MARLSREFYNGNTVDIAKELLGKILVRRLDGELLAGRITETEAYIGRCDKACHAYNYRKTDRTSTMFMAPGHAYIYFIYGIHHCLNFVTEPEGEPSAVLIRGGEIVYGRETACRLRYGTLPDALTPYQRKNFLNGPGKLCKALGITRQQNRLDLTTDETLFVCESPADVGLPCPDAPHVHLCAGPRIGVDYAEEARDFPWRFWLEQED